MGRRDWASIGTAAASSLLVAALVYAQSQFAGDNEDEYSDLKARSAGDDDAEASKEHAKSADDVKIVVPGIWNSGNTCFMNSLLQAISASPVLIRHLHSVDELLEAEVIYSGGSSPSATAFSRALWSAVDSLRARSLSKAKLSQQSESVFSTLLHSVWGSSATRSSVVLDLSTLEKKLRHISKTFARPHEQQDADELLTITLDVLEKESKYAWRLLSPSLRSLGLDTILHPPLNDSGSSIDEFGRPNSSWWSQTASTPTKMSSADSPSRASIDSSPRKSSVSSSGTDVLQQMMTNAPTQRVPLRNPMEGTLMSLVQCERCGRKSPLRSSPFCVLAVPIPFASCSVVDCLKEFVKPELVEDVECSRCAVVSGRSPKQPARKRLMIGRLPPVLCVRLQRNQFDMRSGHMYKDQTFVAMPKVLDITDACFFSVLAKEETQPQPTATSPWKTDLSGGPDVNVNAMVLALTGQLLPSVKPATSSATNTDHTPTKKKSGSNLGGNKSLNVMEEKNTKYRLVAVIEHIGNAFGGHYVAYRMVERDGQTFWTRCSDDSVVVVPELKVLSSVQCYMCLYERIETEHI